MATAAAQELRPDPLTQVDRARDIVVNRAQPVLCSGGHAVYAHRLIEEATCNYCDLDLSTNTDVFSCRACDYDLCPECHALESSQRIDLQNIVNEVQSSREPAPSPTRMPLSPRNVAFSAAPTPAGMAMSRSPGVPIVSQVSAKAGFVAPVLAAPPQRRAPANLSSSAPCSSAFRGTSAPPPDSQTRGQSAPSAATKRGVSREPAKAFVGVTPLRAPVSPAVRAAPAPAAKASPASGGAASPGVPPVRPGASAVQVKTVDEFTKWCGHYPDSKWAVVKGWANGPSMKSFPSSKLCYNEDALSRLDSFSRVIWDGTNLNRTGHSAVVADFLRAKSHRKAVAFIKSDQVDIFKRSWEAFAAELGGSVIVVAIDADNDLEALKTDSYRFRNLSSDVQDSFRIGRLAMKLTSANNVICMGGNGSIVQEAEASLGDGVQWTIFSLSRGSKETEPSLLDWAATKRSPQVELITGLDNTEANGYFSAAPPAPPAPKAATLPTPRASLAAAKAGAVLAPVAKAGSAAPLKSGAAADSSAKAGFAAATKISTQAAPAALPVNVAPAVRASSSVVQVKTVDEFTKWCGHYDGSKWAVVKGWATGPTRKSLPSSKLCYNAEALSRLDSFSRVIWDGSNLNRTGHSAVVADFLRGKGHRKAVAFIKSDQMDVFLRSWETFAAELAGCIIAVAVDVDNDLDVVKSESYRLRSLSSDAQDSVRIGRLAMKLTGVQNVICMGGNGCLAQEAEASLADGVKWTIFSLSRGSKETELSLLDWAANKRSAQVELITGSDSTEANGFFGAAPAPVAAKAGAVLTPAAKAGLASVAAKAVSPTPLQSGAAAAPSARASFATLAATASIPVALTAGAVNTTAIVRADASAVQVKTVEEFTKWCAHYDGSKWAVVKGWASGPTAKTLPSSKLCYNAEALSRLDRFSRVIWDGSNLVRTGHSAVVADFLRGKSHRKAVAFIKSDQVDVFKRSWETLAAELAGSIIAVAVDVDTDLEVIRRDAYRVSSLSSDALDSFRIGRLAMKLTGVQNVICMGGTGSIAQEAEASLADGVKWTVFALSRGSQESEPSLLDWASRKRSAQVEFITGSDSTEANGYSSAPTAAKAGAGSPAPPRPGAAIAPSAKAGSVTLAPKAASLATPAVGSANLLATNARGAIILAPRPAASAVKVKTVDEFIKWCGHHHYADNKWAAVKGWASGPSMRALPSTRTCYNADALSRLDGFLRVVWDGSNLNGTGHSALVADFLRGSAVKERKVVAFIKSDDVDVFKSSWEVFAAEHAGCVIAVAVDVNKDLEVVRTDASRLRNLPAEAQDSFRIGRLAMKLTGVQNVVCLGGNGGVAQEAEASIGSGVQWTVFSLSRGSKETEPSLLDWAVTARSRQVELIAGSDDAEANGYFSATPPPALRTTSLASPRAALAAAKAAKPEMPSAPKAAAAAAPLPRSLQILADLAAKKASSTAPAAGAASSVAAQAGAAVRGGSAPPPFERFGAPVPRASPAMSNRSINEVAWTGTPMPLPSRPYQTLSMGRPGIESDLAGLRQLTEAAPELLRTKGWFRGADPKTASDLEGWGGISYAGEGAGRVTELMMQVAAVHEGIGRLSALQSLNLTASISLEALPDSIGACSALRTLTIKACPKLTKLPDSIGDLKKLQVLDMSGCKALGSGRQGAALPRTVGELSALETLKLNGCEILTRLPPGFSNLTTLVTLELQGCSNLTALPAKLAEMPNLKKLDVRGCTGVNADPTQGVLGRLTAAGCTVLA